jgi:azurin
LAELKSRPDFVPEKIDTNLDLHQGKTFGGCLILAQMKVKLTPKTGQHFARFAEPADGSPGQLARRSKTNMKKKSAQLIPLIALGCSALLYFVTGCSRAPETPPKEVTVQADDKMRYDFTAFEVSPGQKVSVTFKNIGTTPKYSMGHNFVLLDRTINTGNIQSAFLDKASMEAAHDYVPPGAKEVLAHSKLLGPGESEVVTFNAPYIPGDYLYVCSFPGHYSQGTKGFMTVKQ